jgi:hypothetical protein
LTCCFSTTCQKRPQSGNPPNIGGAPVHFVRAVVEHISMGHSSIDKIATGGVENALGFAGGA